MNHTELENISIVELLNEIHKMPDDSLLEKITTYCEQNELEATEVGEVLAQSNQFKRSLWLNCVDHYQIRDELLHKEWDKTDNLDVW